MKPLCPSCFIPAPDGYVLTARVLSPNCSNLLPKIWISCFPRMSRRGCLECTLYAGGLDLIITSLAIPAHSAIKVRLWPRCWNLKLIYNPGKSSSKFYSFNNLGEWLYSFTAQINASDKIISTNSNVKSNSFVDVKNLEDRSQIKSVLWRPVLVGQRLIHNWRSIGPNI